MPAIAQARTKIVYVQPSPSAINSHQVFIALGEGYFAAEGLELQNETLNGSGPILQALAAGRAQFGRPGPAPLLKARERGVDVKFLFNSLPKSSFGILVRQESAFKTPADLKGKVIGVGTADGAEVGFARAILDDAKMKEPADYRFIAVGDGGPATAGMLRGDIVAYVGSLADRAIMTHRGMPMRNITPEKFQVLFGNGYAAMGDYIAKNPQVVEGFGRALVKASRFVHDPKNIDKALAHCAKASPQEGEDKAFAKALLESVLASSKPFDMAKGWGYQDPKHWEFWHESLVASKELAAPLKDLHSAYTNDFVAKWNA